jgi:CRP-like cAMP-binding protein
MERSDAERRLLARGWLADQPDELRVAVLSRARLLRYAPGNYVFHAGDESGGICGVVAGGIGVYLPTGSGDLRLAHIGRCGIWFGYGPLIRGRRRTLSFSPTEVTWLMQVPLAALQEIASMSPAHQRAILSVGEYGMDTAILIIESLLMQNHSRRIAATLLRVMPHSDEVSSEATPEAVLSQSQLAEMASVGRQLVNRELRQLEDKGWISVSYRKISVLNRDALKAFVEM